MRLKVWKIKSFELKIFIGQLNVALFFLSRERCPRNYKIIIIDFRYLLELYVFVFISAVKKKSKKIYIFFNLK